MTEPDQISIEWGKYGSYDFKVDVANKVLNGNLRGNPASWRRLEFAEKLATFIKHEHCEHSH